jgi:hypothetical protein
MFNFDEMTLDDIETIEQLTGTSIDNIVGDKQPRGKVLKVLIWVMKKKTDPNFTMEQAGKIPFSEAVEMFENVEDQEKKD